MANLHTETQTIRMTRKQFKSLLNETTAVESATSLGAAMEYKLRMLDSRSIVITATADSDHDLVSARIGELARNR